MSANEKIEHIKYKLLAIVEQNMMLTKRIKDLELSNQKLINENIELNDKLNLFSSDLERKEALLREKEEEEPKKVERLKKQLDQYSKDIDDCIEWMQNL